MIVLLAKRRVAQSCLCYTYLLLPAGLSVWAAFCISRTITCIKCQSFIQNCPYTPLVLPLALADCIMLFLMHKVSQLVPKCSVWRCTLKHRQHRCKYHAATRQMKLSEIYYQLWFGLYGIDQWAILVEWTTVTQLFGSTKSVALPATGFIVTCTSNRKRASVAVAVVLLLVVLLLVTL